MHEWEEGLKADGDGYDELAVHFAPGWTPGWGHRRCMSEMQLGGWSQACIYRLEWIQQASMMIRVALHMTSIHIRWSTPAVTPDP